MFMLSIKRLAATGRLLAGSLAILVAAAPDAAIIAAKLSAREVKEGTAGYVEVTFDRRVCLPMPSNQSLQQIINGRVTRLVQARVDGTRISLVVSAISADTVSACEAANTATFALPKLSAGTYTIRVAEANYKFAPILYAIFQIESVAVIDSALTVSPVATPAAIYVIQRDFGTLLVLEDVGTYQVWPTFASELAPWQPVFYVWPVAAAGTSSGLRAVEWLTVDSGPRAGQAFYTVHPAEKAALLRDGFFKAQQPTFAAFAPDGGVCADGHTGIYRAFDSKALIHRFVPASTYRAMIANGWTGEGIAFCAASAPNGQSGWAPN